MSGVALPRTVVQQIDGAVKKYVAHRAEFADLARRVMNDLVENQQLKSLIHSAKYREKDPDHLRDKLIRKARVAILRKRKFRITNKNVFREVDDLAGVRILHINREQLKEIDGLVQDIVKVHQYKLRERPRAYTWDKENETYFRSLGLKVVARPDLYTSIHYVVEAHFNGLGCEVQVRTLAEELWGEVSHTVQYPHAVRSKACQEQLKVLARVASGCTRLVDSIFASVDEYNRIMRKKRRHPGRSASRSSRA